MGEAETEAETDRDRGHRGHENVALMGSSGRQPPIPVLNFFRGLCRWMGWRVRAKGRVLRKCG